jgi:hypothetical protein
MNAMDAVSGDSARLDLWPGSGLPLPSFRSPASCSLTAAHDALLVSFADKPQQSHGEIYLELLALDLDSAPAIATFVQRNSMLKGHDLYQQLRRERVAFPDQADRDFAKQHPQAQRRAEREADALRPPPAVSTLAEFRLAARTLRRLTAEWIKLSGSTDLGDYQPPRDSRSQSWVREPGLDLVARLLPAILRGATPSVEVVAHGPDLDLLPPLIVQPRRPVRPLFEVCALELFNHIARQVTYRQCQNEPCGRLFAIQHEWPEGGATSKRTKYCSRRCAGAAAVRASRRRTAMRRRAEPPGDSTFGQTHP